MLKKSAIFLSSLALLLLLGQTAWGTTILSPVVEMEIEPGQSQKGILKIFNEAKENLFLVSSVEPFVAGNESGRPVYLPPEEKDRFLQWFKLSSSSILIKPGQFAVIPFTVEVPIEAAPGGYYAAIFWKNESAAGLPQDSGVGVSSKVGTLVLLKVKGDLQEKGEIAEFRAGSGNGYFFSLPVDFTVRFANSGNIHLAPGGEIELKNWLGQTEKIEFNPTKNNVLPGSIRQFEIIWGQADAGSAWRRFFSEALFELNHLSFGRYAATLNLSFGADFSQKISRQINFWFVPVRLIVILLISIFILAGLFKINAKVKNLKKKSHGKNK